MGLSFSTVAQCVSFVPGNFWKFTPEFLVECMESALDNCMNVSAIKDLVQLQVIFENSLKYFQISPAL